MSATAIGMKRVFLLSVALAALVGSGCVSFHNRSKQQRRSSTIEFLYPKGREVTEQPTIPHLRLPMSVGIAFVPDETGNYRTGGLSEAQKLDLLEAVAKQFKDQPFIENIEIIPTAYLKAGGGFDNLDQIRTMLGVDVIALVAYDQIQHTDEDWTSLAYWTVVGVFMVPGEKNDTSTMLDTTVFHIPSRKLLFRAPGTSHIKARSTPVNIREELREDAHKGMQQANTQMIANLEGELTRFKKRVKEQPKRFKITRAPGYHGGGNLGLTSLLLICLLCLAARRRREMITQ